MTQGLGGGGGWNPRPGPGPGNKYVKSVDYGSDPAFQLVDPSPLPDQNPELGLTTQHGKQRNEKSCEVSGRGDCSEVAGAIKVPPIIFELPFAHPSYFQ